MSYEHERALKEILTEREYQKSRWEADHDQSHSTQDWSTIMAAYMGKVARAVPPYAAYDDPRNFRRRVTQLGAICLAALENVE